VLEGIIFSLTNFSMQSLLAARAHPDLSRALPAVPARVGHLALLQLVKDVLHLPLYNGVFLTSLEEKLLCLMLQAVDLSDLLRSMTLSQIEIGITKRRVLLLGESFDGFLHQFQMLSLHFEQGLRINLLVLPQVVQIVD
jgi:hypothetical protein